MVIVVHSPEGGSGVTTITALLASCLAYEGYGNCLALKHGPKGIFHELWFRPTERMETGMDLAFRFLKSGNFGRKELKNTVLTLSEHLDLLGASRKDAVFYQRDAERYLDALIRLARSTYDYVIVDAGGEDGATKALLEEADQVVLCLPHNRMVLEQEVKRYAWLGEKCSSFINRYEARSRYPKKDLIHVGGITGACHTIPYEPGLLDAGQGGRIREYVLANSEKRERSPVMTELYQFLSRIERGEKHDV